MNESTLHGLRVVSLGSGIASAESYRVLWRPFRLSQAAMV